MLVFISSGVSEYLASLSSLFAASADHRFRFKKRGQLFIRTHNETLSVAAMRVSNPKRFRFLNPDLFGTILVPANGS
jgi:hypothetical protein